jgi:ATP-dependent DNA ligase
VTRARAGTVRRGLIGPMSRLSPVREPLPRFLAPMLLSNGRASPTGSEWAVEVKFDGIRAQLRVDGDRGWCVVLDGELVHLGGGDGRPDFTGLRRRLAPATPDPPRAPAPATRRR